MQNFGGESVKIFGGEPELIGGENPLELLRWNPCFGSAVCPPPSFKLLPQLFFQIDLARKDFPCTDSENLILSLNCAPIASLFTIQFC